jgi:hypothetical protein
MQRYESIAKKILELIVSHDSDGSGVVRTDLYSLIERALYRSSELGDTAATVDYHLYLLEDAGFVQCFEGEIEDEDDEDDDGSARDTYLLTWAGHDYLENK